MRLIYHHGLNTCRATSNPIDRAHRNLALLHTQLAVGAGGGEVQVSRVSRQRRHTVGWLDGN